MIQTLATKDEAAKSTRWILKVLKSNSLEGTEAIESFRVNVQRIMRTHGSTKCRVYNLPHQEYSLPLELFDTQYLYFFYSHNGNGNGVTKRRVEEIVSALENFPCEVFPIIPFHINNHSNVSNSFEFMQAHHGRGVEFDDGEKEFLEAENCHPESETAPTFSKDLTFSGLSEKYQKVDEENKALQENNTALAAENTTLKNEVTTLKGQVEIMDGKLQTLEVNIENERKSWKEEFKKMQEEHKKEIEKIQKTIQAELNKQQNSKEPREWNAVMTPQTDLKPLYPIPQPKKVKMSYLSPISKKPLRMEIEESQPEGIGNSRSKNEVLFVDKYQLPKETKSEEFEEYKDSASNILESKTQNVDNRSFNAVENMTKAQKFYYSAISEKPHFHDVNRKGMELFCDSLSREKIVIEQWQPLLNRKDSLYSWKGARLSQITPTSLADACFSYSVEVESLYKLLCYLLIKSENNNALQIYKKVMEQLQAEEFRAKICYLLAKLNKKNKET